MLSPNVPIWEDGSGLDLPTLTGDHEAHVCVVGLGGSGLAAIDECLSLGVSVVGLDAVTVASGASGRNGGLLRAGFAFPHHEAVERLGRDRARQLYQLTIDERERMLRETPEPTRRIGYLRRAADEEEARDCRAQHDALLADGFPASWYDGPLGRGLLVHDDAACNPLTRCRALARRLVKSGAQLYEHSRVERITSGVVETADTRVRCRRVIVAADGGLASVLPELAGAVRSVRLQMLGAAPDPSLTIPHAVGSRWGWDYWQRLPTGAIALGGCRDVGGDAEFTDDASPSREVQDALERVLRAELGVTTTITHRWAAVVSYTENALPLLREGRPGVWVAGAYSGTGNLVGAALARAAVRRALGIPDAWPL